MGEQTHVCAATMKCILLLAIVACAGAQFQYFTGEISQKPARRSYTSGFASGNASSSAVTSPSSAYTSGTPAPTPSPTEAGSTTITQVVTMGFAGLSSHTDFAGSNEQTLANFGYGKEIGIVTSTNSGTSYTAGCSVSSTAATARRADMSVTITAVVTPALAAAAQTAANAITTASLTQTMTDVLTNLKASDNATYGSMANPTVSAVAAPTVSTAGGSGKLSRLHPLSSTLTVSGVSIDPRSQLCVSCSIHYCHSQCCGFRRCRCSCPEAVSEARTAAIGECFWHGTVLPVGTSRSAGCGHVRSC